MTFEFHHCKLPRKGPFTWLCAILIDLYELPFPGICLPTTPWLGGYTASPILYWLFAYGPLCDAVANAIQERPVLMQYLRPWGAVVPPPTNDNADWVERVQFWLCAMYLFHFARRLLESIFVNAYTSQTTRRLSDVELSYYVLWGCLCGASNSPAMGFGVVPPPVFVLGAIVWAAGQMANAYCHYQLKVFKDETRKGRRTIPGMPPFRWFLMPHYTAEIVGWTGYCICSGFNAASVTIWLLSLGTLQIFAHSRRLQYIKMYKDGMLPEGCDANVYDPASRWGVLPFLERI